jgi:hypothetical protein
MAGDSPFSLGCGRDHDAVTRPLVLVLGIAGETPVAGVAWQVLHYLEGFRRAGWDAVYLEDTGSWPYDPHRNEVTDDPAYTLSYLGGLLGWAGFGDRWAYVAPNGRAFGPVAGDLDALIARADAIANVTGATVLHDALLDVPLRLYVQSDPVLAQIEVAQGNRFTIDLLSAHTHHFSFGENLGTAACAVPVERFHYHATRQPVVLEWWAPNGAARAGADGRFTTVSSWKQTGKDVTWDGETYFWSKDREFLRFVDLPRRTSHKLELALACEDADVLALLGRNGWHVVDALPLSAAILPYRDYVRGSRGEFSVAKDQYVRTRSGWFSDRSASYLAAGKPVVTQDTGFGSVIPTGEGLFAFTTSDDALAALDAIAADYGRHAAAASEIAREYFEAERVVGSMLAAAGV